MAVFQASIVFAAAFLVAAASTPIIRRFALQWKLGDKPNGRKIHTDTIPHLGGIAIFLGAITSAGVAFGFFAERAAMQPWFHAKLLVPVALVVALGLMDDVKNLKARQKLTVQVIAAALLALMGIQMLIGLPVLDQNMIFVVLLSSIYLVGISSSVNLIDGHDGLAAGLSIISAAAFAMLGWSMGIPHVLYLSLAVAGACGGFLLYNFPPGRIFMGDNGSMFLGLSLGIIACSITMAQPAIKTFVAVTFVLAIPMLDCWLAMARRLALRAPIFQADCKHMHHLIASFGFSQRQTLFILYSMQAVMAFLAILAARGHMAAMILGCIVLCFAFLTFLRVMVASDTTARKVPREFAANSVPSWEK